MAAPRTISETVGDLTQVFAAAGIESARLDARVLTAHVLGLEPTQLFMRGLEAFPREQAAALDAVKQRRLAREPVARIRGYREFFGKDYLIGPDTLEPRPDSETIIEAAQKLAPRLPADGSRRILDLGTGTGCLLLSILSLWPQAAGVGIDIAQGAVDMARKNAARLGLAERARFQAGDWCGGLSERYDLIVANPPYIADEEMAGLAPEVARFDPMRALAGGVDGLVAYRAFVPALAQHLSPGGIVLLEVGARQAMPVSALCAAHGLGETAFHADLAGVSRVVEAAAP
jgi:release factor glutamine methyltransferase